MKIGKAKLKRILSRETGIPIRDITVYGRYECFGSKERLVIGAHTITALNGEIKICEPDYAGEKITYKSRAIKEGGSELNEGRQAIDSESVVASIAGDTQSS